MNISTRDLVWPSDKVFEVDVIGKVHFAGNSRKDKSLEKFEKNKERVNFNLLSSIGKRELDLTIKSARSEKSGIESILSVGSHDDFHIHSLVETVHLVQQLEEDTLNFSISTGLRIESLGGDSIDFINEDDCRGIFFCKAEDVTDHSWTFTEIFLHEFGTDDSDE